MLYVDYIRCFLKVQLLHTYYFFVVRDRLPMLYREIDPANKSRGLLLLGGHWKPSAIASTSECHLPTACR